MGNGSEQTSKNTNYERFGKAILSWVVADCLKINNSLNKRKIYYRHSCPCGSTCSHSIGKVRLIEKSRKLWEQLPYMPPGARYNNIDLSIEDIIKIHEILVCAYNAAVIRYKLAEVRGCEKFKEIKSMWDDESI